MVINVLQISTMLAINIFLIQPNAIPLYYTVSRNSKNDVTHTSFMAHTRCSSDMCCTSNKYMHVSLHHQTEISAQQIIIIYVYTAVCKQLTLTNCVKTVSVCYIHPAAAHNGAIPKHKYVILSTTCTVVANTQQ